MESLSRAAPRLVHRARRDFIRGIHIALLILGTIPTRNFTLCEATHPRVHSRITPCWFRAGCVQIEENFPRCFRLMSPRSESFASLRRDLELYIDAQITFQGVLLMQIQIF